MLDLLLSLAEEASALDSRRQASFVNKAMQPQAARVFDTLGKVLQGSSSASGHSIASFLPNCGTC